MKTRREFLIRAPAGLLAVAAACRGQGHNAGAGRTRLHAGRAAGLRHRAAWPGPEVSPPPSPRRRSWRR